MGKGKKKARGKGKKRDGKKTNDNACGGRGGVTVVEPPPQEPEQVGHQGPTPEQCERAREAAANRTEDPLENWIRADQEECPICMLPLPLGGAGGGAISTIIIRSAATIYWFCCGKTMCGGCLIGAGEVEYKNGGEGEKLLICPFCRSNNNVDYRTEKSQAKSEMKRANAGQPDSMCRVASYYFGGEMGCMQNKAKGLKLYQGALEAGSGRAARSLGLCYDLGDGVDQDEEKALEYYQRAVELGFEPAYSSVGYILMERGEIEEGMLNFRKAAMCGTDDKNIFDELRTGFNDGFITKDEYAFTLRKSQAAVNERKSEERELYKEYLNYQDSPEGRKMLMKISGQSKSY